jgi:hypothetical protein
VGKRMILKLGTLKNLKLLQSKANRKIVSKKRIFSKKVKAILN